MVGLRFIALLILKSLKPKRMFYVVIVLII
nr:MAG TPA: hypothetical protein [Caudoviricetes sp.]